MTNIFMKKEKISMKRFLFGLAEKALTNEGWLLEKSDGKKRIYKISREGEAHSICIRTSQDAWFAFVPKGTQADLDRIEKPEWGTLEDVDFVVLASVDNKENPRYGKVHLMDARTVTQTFDQAFESRRLRNVKVHEKRGFWISVYKEEQGLGHRYPVLLEERIPASVYEEPEEIKRSDFIKNEAQIDYGNPKTAIEEAKRIVAEALGIETSAIRINIDA